MSKRLTWMCVWAVMFALCGCSDEGNKERDSEKTCDTACADGFECRNGACVEKDDKTEPGTDNACDSCKAGEICVNKKCEPCPHVVCGDKCCGENEVCEADKCSLKTAEGCDSCSPDQICEDQTCKACPNAVCDQVCCSEGQVCDLFTKKCAVAGMDGGAPCNGLFCFEGQVCSETGECAVRCDDGRYGCGDNAVCCDANSECFEDTYCRVVCDADQTMCGKVGAEVCCAAEIWSSAVTAPKRSVPSTAVSSRRARIPAQSMKTAICGVSATMPRSVAFHNLRIRMPAPITRQWVSSSRKSSGTGRTEQACMGRRLWSILRMTMATARLMKMISPKS